MSPVMGDVIGGLVSMRFERESDGEVRRDGDGRRGW
jgi:hypothetical protein